MTAVETPPLATATRSRPSVLLGAAFGIALLCIVVYAFASGDARHLESGDPFPGTFTATIDVVGYFLGFLAAALTLGGLVFIITAPDLIDWRLAALVGVGAILGGVLGSRYGRRLPPNALRAVIVVVGVAGLVKFVFFP